MITVYEDDGQCHRDAHEMLLVFYGPDGFCFTPDKHCADIAIGRNSLIYRGRQYYQDTLKKSLFRLLSTLTGYIPGSGIMTGIRPSQPGFRLAMRGFRDIEIREHYIKEYFTSDGFASQVAAVAVKEAQILSKYDENEFASLYISIPFCSSVCAYCTFSSGTADDDTIDAYVEAVIKEAAVAAEQLAEEGRQIRCVYVGGGTPALLRPAQIRRLFSVLRNSLSGCSEITFEAGRPDCITRDKLEAIFESGVTRLCINTQTANDETLRIISRGHSCINFIEKYRLAECIGFENISTDLIFGFENENMQDMCYSLETILDLKPQNIAIHPLAMKKGTAIKVKKGSINDDEFWYNVKCRLLSDGYYPYYMYRQKACWNNFESTGYSIAGSECLYNMAMTENFGNLAGCGLRAAGRKDGARTVAGGDLNKYLQSWIQE